MSSKEDHMSRLHSLGFDDAMLESFAKLWEPLQCEHYEIYAMYTGAEGSFYAGRAACAICSKKANSLHWEKVITPSQDSAAIYSVCGDCDSQYVEAAIRQKALGRLLKERNTRPT
jgi:hypothetical protein